MTPKPWRFLTPTRPGQAGQIRSFETREAALGAAISTCYASPIGCHLIVHNNDRSELYAIDHRMGFLVTVRKNAETTERKPD